VSEKKALDGGYLGEWVSDSDGRPAFRIFPDRIEGRSDLVLPEAGWRGLWHQVGSMRITATAYADGGFSFYVADDGLVKISRPGKEGIETLGRKWRIIDDEGEVILDSMSSSNLRAINWGASYAEWIFGNGEIKVRRRLSAPLEDFPAVLLETCIFPGKERRHLEQTVLLRENCQKRKLFFEEEWVLELYPMVPGILMSKMVPPPSSYRGLEKLLWYSLFTISSLWRRLTEALRRLSGWMMLLKYGTDSVSGASVLTLRSFLTPKKRVRRRRGLIPLLPGSIFATFNEGGSSSCTLNMKKISGKVIVKMRAQISQDLPQRLHAFLGISQPEDLPDVLEMISSQELENLWTKDEETIRIHFPGYETFEREVSWHCAYLRDGFLYDRYFDCHYLPQGSAYGFIHGAQGAPRDYAFCAVPLTYFCPSGAREILKSIMRMMRKDGAIYYSHVGRGVCTSGGIHPFPSDLPLFFMWALTEYVWATGDYELLDEEISFYGGFCGKQSASTAIEKVVIAFRFLKESIGLGEHGMLRLSGGDWMDPLPLLVENPKRLKYGGESGFSSALAVYVLPKAADLVKSRYPNEAEDMREFAGLLKVAMEESWQGEWFLRGWDGSGNPIGHDRLFLDCQTLCLIAQIGTRHQRMSLIQNIFELCDKESNIGATILDRPKRARFSLLPPGSDCNAGVWPIVCALLTWGYALHSPELAWQSLKKLFLSTHARAYPHVWFGIWSGPDSYNSHFAERPGETFVQPATPMMEFPIMNANAHAAPLLGILKFFGVEATQEGIKMKPNIPEWIDEWRFETALFTAFFRDNELDFRLKGRF